MVCTKAKTNDWILSTATLENDAYQELYTIRRLTGVIGCLYLGFMVLAYRILSVSIFRPLQRLAGGLQEVSKGRIRHIDVKNENFAGQKDEVSELIDHYNVMVDEIDKLMVEIRKEEKAKNEERMKVLSMQISPHFIYNTLNTIKWMAAANRQNHICKMVECLIKMMMDVTYRANEEVTLKEELELLDCYIYIQKMRFMNFEVEYCIPEELLSYRVNKLVLQPFVENSILHAFKDKEEVGIICIKASLKTEYLELIVEDNGKGFEWEAEKVKKEESGRKDHVGIQNVCERIRLNYGGEYGVIIESIAEKGTTVKIHLPIYCESSVTGDESAMDL